jgi:hypothetical protein
VVWVMEEMSSIISLLLPLSQIRASSFARNQPCALAKLNKTTSIQRRSL